MNKLNPHIHLMLVAALLLGIGIGVLADNVSNRTRPSASTTTSTTTTQINQYSSGFDLDTLVPDATTGPGYSGYGCNNDQGWDSEVDSNSGAVKIHFANVGDQTMSSESQQVKAALDAYIQSKLSIYNSQVLSFYLKHYDTPDAAQQALDANLSLLTNDIGPWLANRAKGSLSKVKTITFNDAVTYYQSGLKWVKAIKSFAGPNTKGRQFQLTKNFSAGASLNVLNIHPGLNVNADWDFGGSWVLEAHYAGCPGLGLTGGNIIGGINHRATIKLDTPGVKLSNGSTINISAQADLNPTGLGGSLGAGYKF